MKTEYEMFDEQINPQRKIILERYPNVDPLVIKAFANLCFSLGKSVGYDEGQKHAKKGIDERHRMEDFDWKSFSFRKSTLTKKEQ